MVTRQILFSSFVDVLVVEKPFWKIRYSKKRKRALYDNQQMRLFCHLGFVPRSPVSSLKKTGRLVLIMALTSYSAILKLFNDDEKKKRYYKAQLLDSLLSSAAG